MKLDIHHHHHHGPLPLGELLNRFDLLQHALAGVLHHLAERDVEMATALEKLQQEVSETKDAAHAAEAKIDALRGDVADTNAKLAAALADLAQARASDDEAALDAASNALNEVQAELAAKIADPAAPVVVVADPVATDNTGSAAPAADTPAAPDAPAGDAAPTA